MVTTNGSDVVKLPVYSKCPLIDHVRSLHVNSEFSGAEIIVSAPIARGFLPLYEILQEMGANVAVIQGNPFCFDEEVADELRERGFHLAGRSLATAEELDRHAHLSVERARKRGGFICLDYHGCLLPHAAIVNRGHEKPCNGCVICGEEAVRLAQVAASRGGSAVPMIAVTPFVNAICENLPAFGRNSVAAVKNAVVSFGQIKTILVCGFTKLVPDIVSHVSSLGVKVVLVEHRSSLRLAARASGMLVGDFVEFSGDTIAVVVADPFYSPIAIKHYSEMTGHWCIVDLTTAETSITDTFLPGWIAEKIADHHVSFKNGGTVIEYFRAKTESVGREGLTSAYRDIEWATALLCLNELHTRSRPELLKLTLPSGAVTRAVHAAVESVFFG